MLAFGETPSKSHQFSGFCCAVRLRSASRRISASCSCWRSHSACRRRSASCRRDLRDLSATTAQYGKTTEYIVEVRRVSLLPPHPSLHLAAGGAHNKICHFKTGFIRPLRHQAFLHREGRDTIDRRQL